MSGIISAGKVLAEPTMMPEDHASQGLWTIGDPDEIADECASVSVKNVWKQRRSSKESGY